MTESRFGFFGFVGEDETAMTIHAWSGEAMKGCSIADKPSRFPIADAGVWGEAVRRREPFILNDYGKYHSAKKGLPAGHVPLSRLMVVPIFSSGKIVSLAAVANRDRDYGADDVKQLKAFGESVQSIIDRKGAQADLAAEKERLAVTLRSIGDGVITTDIAGLVTEMNGVAESLTGWTRREAAGRPLAQVFNIINEYTREICENPVERVLSTGKVIELANHTLLVARDGTERVIADSGAPIKDAEGKVLGVVLVFRDTTEKQRLMESAQRTEKLEALSVLAGGIAHDFNNLLEGVFGYVGLARDSSSASPEVVARLDKALGVSERAKALTRQLLTFSKGGAPERKNVALGALLREASAFALAGTAIEREFEIPEGLWPCLGDRYQLGQVIDNIVINAREAMPGGGKITIRAANVSLAQGQKPRMAPGDYVMVSIRDSGTGIAPEEAKRVFDPFYTTKDKGTGLGLAVCHSIILKHEGTVELESRPGEGTEIRFYLPRSSQEGQAEAASSSRTSTSARTTAQGSGSVLVMDDEEFIREILSDILSGMGYTPIEAANGAQALEICRGLSTGGPGLSAAVLDLTVPGGLGGKAIIKELRAAYPRLPVFAASGYSEDPVIARPWEFGFTDSIRKPFDRAELARMFAKHLGTDKAGAVETGGDHDR
jgi:PAS domain S-box-containing protein